MNNNFYCNYISKNQKWFYNSYNKKVEELHEKSSCGSVLKYISYDDFIKKYPSLLDKKYFEKGSKYIRLSNLRSS